MPQVQIPADGFAGRYSRYPHRLPALQFFLEVAGGIPSAVPSGSLPKAFAFGIRELKIRFGADVIGFKILLEFDEPGRGTQ